MTRALHVSDALSLPLELVTESVGILAVKRAGKSHTAKKLVEQLHAAKQQVVVVDPKGDWWGLRSSADGKGPGIPIVIVGGEHGDVPLEPGSGELVAKMVVEQRVSVLLDLAELRKHQVATFMTAFLETLYRLKAKELYRTPLMLVIDEADAIAPQRPQKGEERMLGAAEDIVRRGGQRGIGIILVSQRAAVLNKNVLTQVGVLILLRTTGSQDIDAVDEWIKKHGQQEKREKVMASIAALPRGTAWVWAPGWPDERGIFKQVVIDRCKTFDSGATPKPGEQRVLPKTVADVDLVAFRKEMAATIEKAKAEDPRELRRRIGELEKALKAQPTKVAQSNPTKTVPDPQVAALARRLQKAVEQAMKFIVRINAEDFFTSAGEGLDRGEVQKAIDQAAQAITKLLERKLDARNQEIERLKRDAQRVVGLLKQLLDQDVAVDLTVRHNEPFTVAQAPALKRPRSAGRPLPGGTMLAKGELAVLTAVAQHGDQGVSREQLTILTGYKRSSRDTYLQRLAAQQLVEIIGGGQIFATEAGLAALGPDFEPLPTGDALREYWLQRLKGGEQKILSVLIEAYPKALSRDEISEVTDYQRSSRDTYLQRLKARQLVLDEGRGAVKASPTLF